MRKNHNVNILVIGGEPYIRRAINLTLHKLEEFMEGEIFDEMVENLSLQAQQEQLNKVT